MNIIISGWPGAGTTSLALLLCYLLEYKYIYGGGVFKHMAKEIVGDTSGRKYIEFEQKYGNDWDSIWEPYARWKLETSDHILLEGKTAGFFAESERYYEIMMIAKVSSRANRAVKDGRSDPEQTIMARDVVVRQRWINELGIDIYDPQQISDSYDLILDNSNMTIEEEVEYVLRHLEEDYRFPQSDLQRERKHAHESVERLKTEGKDKFRAQLEKKGLIVPPREVFREWNKHFGAHIAKLPAELQQVIKSNH